MRDFQKQRKHRHPHCFLLPKYAELSILRVPPLGLWVTFESQRTKTFRLDTFVLYLLRASTDASSFARRVAKSDTTFGRLNFFRSQRSWGISYRVGKARRHARLILRCSVLHSFFSPHYARCVLRNLTRVASLFERVSNLAAFLVQQSLKRRHRPFCPTVASRANQLCACRTFCSRR